MKIKVKKNSSVLYVYFKRPVPGTQGFTTEPANSLCCVTF